MIRGWYTGASGMTAQQNRLNVISNNLANVDTTGFKKDTAVSRNFSELLIRRTSDDGVYKTPFGSADAAPIIGRLGLGVETNESFTDFSQGSYKETASKTDMALSAPGFFTVQTPAGERYTRNGNFMIGKEGLLETKDGYPVLGEKGVIYVADTEFFVDKDGVIYDADGMNEIDRFKTVRFDNERYLKKQGASLYAHTDISGPAHIAEGEERPAFLQGFIETSNVNIVNEMVQMIEVNRAYEANQKTVQAGDTMMSVLWGKTASLRG